MKKLYLLLLIGFLLSACTPAVIATPASVLTETITPAPTATQTPSPIPIVTPTPTPIGGGSGKLIFEYYKAGFEKSFPNLKGQLNIFISSIDGTDLTPITNELKGFNSIESISPDGQMVLVSSRSNFAANGDLYLIRLDSLGSEPVKLASGLMGGKQAIFLDSTRIVYIGQGRQGYGFYIANIDGTTPEKIGAPIGRGARILSTDQTRVYWGTIEKKNFRDSSDVLYTYGDFQTLWWTNIDGSGQGKLESNGQQIIGSQNAFSPDGKSIAWIPAGLEDGCSLLSGLSIWTPLIRDGSYTKELERPSMFIGQKSPHLKKVIDIPYVEDYVRHCMVLHVASLSDMDKDIKIPLIPPYNPEHDDFFYHKEYDLTWWPDGSKILAYDGGGVMRYLMGVTDHYPVALYEVSPMDPNPKLALLKVLSNSSMSRASTGAWPSVVDSFSPFNFSPDGRQLLFTKYSSNDQGSMINLLNLETKSLEADFGRTLTPDAQVQRVRSVYWLP